MSVSGTTAEYEAQAVLLIQPSTNTAGGTGVADANRYLQTQLSVLKSVDLAESVATKLGGKWDRDLVTASIRVEERVGTDIVDVYAKDVDAAGAQNLANSYVELYQKNLEDTAKDLNQSNLDQIDDQLNDLGTYLQQLGAAIATEKDDYVNQFIAESIPGCRSCWTSFRRRRRWPR
ncbi:MAG: hypothetical protein R2715_20650 [Ilumatobacteraceae bacterium]